MMLVVRQKKHFCLAPVAVRWGVFLQWPRGIFFFERHGGGVQQTVVPYQKDETAKIKKVDLHYFACLFLSNVWGWNLQCGGGGQPCTSSPHSLGQKHRMQVEVAVMQRRIRGSWKSERGTDYVFSCCIYGSEVRLTMEECACRAKVG